MAGEGGRASITSESYYASGGANVCGTPRLPWRSISWTPRSREREPDETSSATRPASGGPQIIAKRGEQDTDSGNDRNDFGKQTQLLCSPLSSLSIAQRADGVKNQVCSVVGEERKFKKVGRGRNGLDIKLDLGALQQVTFQEHDASEPSDTELSQKRGKMALCEKQCSRIRAHLYFGSSLVAQDYDVLRSNKISHIVNCVGYVCSEYFPSSFQYRVLWLQDSPSEDIFPVLYDCFDYIEDVKDQGGRVYVHCCQGVSRSSAIVIAYLMWREGRTFEDVFEDVKSLRTVTSPNMGFVFQLMNWQSIVLGSPKTSYLRMFRMAPHSPYDPLHQVPKTVNNPSMSALDSRGAFVIQFANRLYVWQGRMCGRCMVASADKVAFQLIRYERALGPILAAKEGNEPSELSDALKDCSPAQTMEIFSREDADCAAGFGCATTRPDLGSETPRMLLNHLYDADFEAIDKARSGEVLDSVPDGANLRGWDGRWNLPRHDFCCGVTSTRNKR